MTLKLRMKMEKEMVSFIGTIMRLVKILLLVILLFPLIFLRIYELRKKFRHLLKETIETNY